MAPIRPPDSIPTNTLKNLLEPLMDGDSYRTDFIYKGKGKVIFNQKPFSSRLKVIRVYYDPKEDGF